MQAVTYEHTLNLVNRLGLFDQIQLFEYLSSLLDRSDKTDATTLTEQHVKVAKGDDSAWDDLFKIGDSLMNVPPAQSQSLTSTLLSMRR